MRAYEYRHVVGFEETSLAGNVYYVSHIRWQGRCREMFLREHVPDILKRLSEDFFLLTVRCSCDYLAELSAFDEIAIRMRLGERAQNRLSLLFDYVRIEGNREEVIARGEQTIACMRLEDRRLVPSPIPEFLLAALRPYELAD
jgi:enediyne biosynthesis thioesterase